MISAPRADRLALTVILLVTAARFWMSGVFELIGDEAYYWLWSKHPAAGYYSKPPGVAWAILLGTAVLGETERGVRLPAILCSALTAWGIYRLGREVCSPRIGLAAVAIALVTPLFWAGSLLMTIDSLSVCAWVWAANALWDLNRRETWARWIGLGLAIGLGLLAKPTLLAFFVVIALWLLWNSEKRRWLRSAGFWTAVAIALAGLAPPLWWNATNDWVTFAHLRERGALDRAWAPSLESWLSFLGGQAGVAGPWLFGAFLAAILWRRLRTPVPPDAARFFTALWAPLFAFYAVLALNDPGQPNWPSPSWIGAILHTAAAWVPLLDRHPRALSAVRTSFALLVIAAIGIHAALLVLHVPAEGNRDPFERVRGHRDLALQLDSLKKERGAAFLIGSHYQTASLLTWYSPSREIAYTVPQKPPRNQFDLWPSYRDRHPPGSRALYVARGRNVPAALRLDFQSVEEIGPFRGLFRGRPERTYWVYLCEGLRPEPVP
ncbi:MAG: glycosyltransferase family 39 protein [Kiritimatiellae bacterium]|nr:glycosyltransferase family 39 protein [Kiritimatiellia bacterium]MDW8458891.1 glycosyltransferase family 39 protein [Verrucomicrobiota bacterium]